MRAQRNVIAVVNEKGGVGKTATAVNLAAALGELREKVLVVDLDAQGSATRWLGGEKDGRVLLQKLEDGESLEDAVVPSSAKSVSIIQGGRSLAAAQARLSNIVGPERLLWECLSKTDGPWDWIFLDCPPSLALITVNALAAATHALIPTEAAPLSFDGLADLVTTISAVQDRLNADLTVGAVVPCRANSRRVVFREAVGSLERWFPGKVPPVAIRENVALTEAPGHGLPVTVYAPKSNGAADYRKLARWLRKEMGK